MVGKGRKRERSEEKERERKKMDREDKEGKLNRVIQTLIDLVLESASS